MTSGSPEHGDVFTEVRRGIRSWGAHEAGGITLSTASGERWIPIAYDDRGAPYPTDETGRERDDLLLSLSDEDDLVACAWASPAPGSRLVGLGCDLVSIRDFAEDPRGERMAELLLTSEERALAQTLIPDNVPASRAVLFGAKEASFKACAAPLRTWYREHDEKLIFEVRHFHTVDGVTERGDARDKAAQHALDALGIVCLSFSYTTLDDKILVVSRALQ